MLANGARSTVAACSPVLPVHLPGWLSVCQSLKLGNKRKVDSSLKLVLMLKMHKKKGTTHLGF